MSLNILHTSSLPKYERPKLLLQKFLGYKNTIIIQNMIKKHLYRHISQVILFSLSLCEGCQMPHYPIFNISTITYYGPPFILDLMCQILLLKKNKGLKEYYWRVFMSFSIINGYKLIMARFSIKKFLTVKRVDESKENFRRRKENPQNWRNKD